MTPELPLNDRLAADLDDLLEELDEALDASFLGDLATALERMSSAPSQTAGALA